MSTVPHSLVQTTGTHCGRHRHATGRVEIVEGPQPRLSGSLNREFTPELVALIDRQFQPSPSAPAAAAARSTYADVLVLSVVALRRKGEVPVTEIAQKGGTR